MHAHITQPGVVQHQVHRPGVVSCLRSSSATSYSAQLTPTLPHTHPCAPATAAQIPLSDFGCGAPLAELEELERFDFQNTNERNALFCLTDVRLT
jgi:hypothetical protein